MSDAPERIYLARAWAETFVTHDERENVAEYIRADVSATRIADLTRQLAGEQRQHHETCARLAGAIEREVGLTRQLAEARVAALEEAAVAGGDAAAAVLRRSEPDAGALKVQLYRQAIAKSIRNMKDPTP